MNRHPSPTLLAALLLLPMSGLVEAGQTINITGTVNHKVVGNGDIYNNGDEPINANPTDASGNTVNVSSTGSVTGSVDGGYFVEPIGSASANGNSVTSSGTITVATYGAYVQADNGTATANHNTVTILDGPAGIISGGASRGDVATASHNAIAIHGGSTGTIRGGDTGGVTSSTASHNTVIISGGATGSVYGGDASVSGPGSSVASNNTVIIRGGSVGEVTGGEVHSIGGSISAINNTVTIQGATTMSGSLRGGYQDSYGSGTGDLFTGNTLHLKTAGLAVNNLSGFQYLNFYLPTTLGAGDTMLTVTGTANLTDGGSRRSTVNVGINGASSPLQKGDRIILIDASGGSLTGTPANTTANGSGMQGVTLQYGFDITTSANQLLATVNSVGTNEQAKALSEGFVSGAAHINQGADLVAGAGTAEAVRAAGGAAPINAFGAFSGGDLRHDTGSHVDVKGFSLLAGLAWATDVQPGHLTLGAFFEHGTGSYDTYNAFSTGTVRSDGDIRHFGGGVLGRLDFAGGQAGHFYADASARLGKVENEYDSNDLRDSSGRKASYDSSSAYYGLHLGGGYVWKLNEKAGLDLHAKYFWTRQDGDSVRLSTGEPVKFKAVDSQRLRLGGRFAYAINTHLTPYVGAAWEHEFDGKAKASTHGFAIDAPSLRGDTAIGELGLSFTPSATLPLSFDFGVQGYTGKREGVTGTVQAKYTF